MRDVTTVPMGEPVRIEVDGWAHHDGRLRQAFDGIILVDTCFGTVKIAVSNPRTRVLLDGAELGFIEPDPPLPTTPPDLE